MLAKAERVEEVGLEKSLWHYSSRALGGKIPFQKCYYISEEIIELTTVYT